MCVHLTKDFLAKPVTKRLCEYITKWKKKITKKIIRYTVIFEIIDINIELKFYFYEII